MFLSHKSSTKVVTIIKRVGENFGGDEYVYGIDIGGGFMDVYLSPNSSICIH